MSSHQREHAFSLVELLIAIAILGALCGIGIPALSAVRGKAVDLRLQSDVDTINRAIRVFQVQGGRLDGVTDPNAILNKIKSPQANSSGLVHFLGAADQMIDPHLTAIVRSSNEIGSDQARAAWNTALKQFVIEHDGRGVTQFLVAAD